MGYRTILYGSKYYLLNVWCKAADHPTWLAHYVDWSSYESPYQMWQVCDWGRIDGIEGNVDFDILFETEDQQLRKSAE